jgi:23S rRNA (cytosine1962-C5)-methyltransferase
MGRRAALDAAIDHRLHAGLAQHGCVRLVDGTADGLPGIVVETFGPTARVESTHDSGGLDDIAEQVLARWPSLTGAVAVQRRGRGEVDVRVACGHVPRAVIVHERGRRFLARPREPEAVGAGIFADQREGRQLIAAHARGGPHLNLFAHAGAFGVVAATAGASRIDHVDAARKCARWSALNLALNGFDPRGHRFIVGDALKYLERAARRGPTYRTIVCDPPTAARKKAPGRKKAAAIFATRDHLSMFAASCLSALLPGGALLLSCNDRRLRQHDFERAVEEGARTAQRSLAHAQPLPLPPDFLSTDPNEQSTKGVFVIVSE